MKKSIFLLMCTLFSLTMSAQKSTAQVDTVVCYNQCIVKFISKTTDKGTVKIYAVYKDDKNHVNEIIPVNKSTWEYIALCKENGIEPTLGIKLRNGVINSIIRYKPRFRVR